VAVLPKYATDAAVVGPLGGLLVSRVKPAAPMMMLRPLRWYRDLAKLGIALPLFLVHDIGLLYAAPKEQLELGIRPGALEGLARHVRGVDLFETYGTMIAEIAQSEASARARTMRLSDEIWIPSSPLCSRRCLARSSLPRSTPWRRRDSTSSPWPTRSTSTL
jgi:hypothetical protein